MRDAEFILRSSLESVIRDDFQQYFGRIHTAVGLALEELADTKRKQGAESRERSREQRAETTEQRAKSRAESREQSRVESTAEPRA